MRAGLDGVSNAQRADAREHVAGYHDRTLIERVDHCTLDRLTELWWDRFADTFADAFRANECGDWAKTAAEQRAKQEAWLGQAIREGMGAGSIPLPDCFIDD